MAGIENNIIYGGGFKLQTSSSRDISDMQRTSLDVSSINHVGTPEGSISANPSSLCYDPVSGIVYVKQSGTGNTGWAALSTSGSGGSTVYFQSYLSAAINDVTGDGTIFTIPFDTTIVNAGSAYNTTTGIFTVPAGEGGMYLFTYSVFFSGILFGTFNGTTIAVGGSPFNYRVAQFDLLSGTTGKPAIQVGSFQLSLSAGDTVSIDVSVSGGAKTVEIGGDALSPNTSPSTFNGTKLS